MINKIYRDYHSQIHKGFDYVPVISMGSSIVHVIKLLKKYAQRKSDKTSRSILKQKKIEYYSKKQLNHLSRALLGLIPIIGNIVMLIYDKLLKKVDLPKKSAKIVIPKTTEDLPFHLQEDVVALKNSLEELNSVKTHHLNALNHVERLIDTKQRLNSLFETYNRSNFEKEQSKILLEGLYCLQNHIYDEILKKVEYIELKALVELIMEGTFLKLRLSETAIGDDYSIEELKVKNSIKELNSLLNLYEKALTKPNLSPNQQIVISNHKRVLNISLHEMKSLENDLSEYFSS